MSLCRVLPYLIRRRRTSFKFDQKIFFSLKSFLCIIFMKAFWCTWEENIKFFKFNLKFSTVTSVDWKMISTQIFNEFEHLWACFWHGRLLFCVDVKLLILIIQNKSKYNNEFTKQIEFQFKRQIIPKENLVKFWACVYFEVPLASL